MDSGGERGITRCARPVGPLRGCLACSRSLGSNPVFHLRGFESRIPTSPAISRHRNPETLAEREGLFGLRPHPPGPRYARFNRLSACCRTPLSIFEGSNLESRPLTPLHGIGILKLWRRERDSNPRRGYKPLTPLAGERLRPLGHLSENFWPGSTRPQGRQ